MGVILAKFRKEKSTQEILEALQENIHALETFTVDTQEQKKRFVGNFLATSIGVYVIAFVIFYFVYFPPRWQERFLYFIPLLLFPIIIILLRYLFTWYFQRKLNKNSKKLTALRAEKKKILEQVMDKETYKVAVNLLARFADKPDKPIIALSASTPKKMNQSPVNRSLAGSNLNQRSHQFGLTPSPKITSNYLNSAMPRLATQIGSSSPATAFMQNSSGTNQQLRRRTPFPILNQHGKGVFDRIVDVLIGDGPQDRFAMICKECYAHNGMALKEDFEYTTFRCAFCSALNPARKARPVAPRLSFLPTALANHASDSEDDKTDSEDEPLVNLKANITEFDTPANDSEQAVSSTDDENAAAAPSFSTPSSHVDEENSNANIQPQSRELSKEIREGLIDDITVNELLKQLEKSDSAIEDITMSPE